MGLNIPVNLLTYGILVFAITAVVGVLMFCVKDKKQLLIDLAVLAAAGLLLLGIYLVGVLGLLNSSPAYKLEEKARAAHSFPEDMEVAQMVDSPVAAMLFYPPDKSDHTFILSIKRAWGPENYQFRKGGSSSQITQGIEKFYHGGSLILLSMNSARVARVECVDGDQYSVDPDKPFALVIPNANTTNSRLELFDVDGKPVALANPALEGAQNVN